MPLHRLQHSKYANYMQIICKKYAQYATKICKKYAINMQNMHKSMYRHILHIYALPTLLMTQWHSDCQHPAGAPTSGTLLQGLRLVHGGRGRR